MSLGFSEGRDKEDGKEIVLRESMPEGEHWNHFVCDLWSNYYHGGELLEYLHRLYVKLAAVQHQLRY